MGRRTLRDPAALLPLPRRLGWKGLQSTAHIPWRIRGEKVRYLGLPRLPDRLNPALARAPVTQNSRPIQCQTLPRCSVGTLQLRLSRQSRRVTGSPLPLLRPITTALPFLHAHAMRLRLPLVLRPLTSFLFRQENTLPHPLCRGGGRRAPLLQYLPRDFKGNVRVC